MSGDTSEDQFDENLRKLLSGDALEARFKELSAEEREKRARERQKAHKQARKAEGKARRRRGLRRMAWGLAAVVVIGGGAFAYLRFGRPASHPDAGSALTHSTTPSASATHTVSPRTDSGPPPDPFAGTPTDKWANGAAGIVIPAAKPIGHYSAAQVEDAYQTTEKLLIAAALDKQSLFDGSPAPFADLLAQYERNIFLSGLNKPKGVPGGPPGSTRGLIVQFAPGTTTLVTSAIRVRGTMTAATASSGGNEVLRVSINYIVAYAVEPPHAPADWMRVVAHFDGPVDFGDWGGSDASFKPVWNLSPASAGGRCGMTDGYVHPEFPNESPSAVQGKGPVIDPYDFNSPETVGCGRTSHT